MKKTLLISPYAPPSTSGSGLMIYNLWSFFPPEQLAVLTADENTDPKIQQYKLTCPYYYYGNEVFSLDFHATNPSRLQKIKRAVKNMALARFIAQIALLAYIPRRIVQVGKRVIREQHIELLFGYSDFGPNLLACYLLHCVTKKPLYLHFFDMYVGNKMPWMFKPIAVWLEPRLFRDAEKIFVMCEKLQEHYQQKYHRSVSVVHNSIIFDQQRPVESPQPAHQPYRLIYIGSLYWAQHQAVMNMVTAVNNMPASDFIEFILYTPHTADYLGSLGIYQNERIKFSYCLPEQVQSVMREADILMVGLSFGSDYPDLINTSSPGKLCDYLLSGTPMLVHAPAESFLSEYARKEHFGYVVDTNSPEAVQKGIAAIKNNPTAAKEFTINANRVARQNHNAEKTAQVLMAQL